MYGYLLDIAVANKAINESQRILSKNFKKVWGKGIGNVGKTFTEASSIGKYTKEAIAKEKGFTDILPNLLKKEGLTMDDFLYMMQKHANGFTSGNNGRLGIPEYVLDKRVSPKIGAEIWRIKPDGTEELIAIFEKEQEKFVRIKK